MNTIEDDQNPLTNFSNCHVGIINNFKALLTLPELANDPNSKKLAKELATKTYRFFDDVILKHHNEEESELFLAVLDSLKEDEPKGPAKDYIRQLTNEHRRLEGIWNELKPSIKRLSKGKDAKDLNKLLIETLSSEYLAHARFEEEVFLPLAEKILSKNDLSALGLSLHMRKDDFKVKGYL